MLFRSTVGTQLGPVADPQPRERATTVCLLVNTLASQGLSYIDFAGLARFHRALAMQCTAHGAQLIVRLKPNNAGLRMASSALSLPAEALQAVLDTKIEQIAQRTDLCVCYGEPTTAASARRPRQPRSRPRRSHRRAGSECSERRKRPPSARYAVCQRADGRSQDPDWTVRQRRSASLSRDTYYQAIAGWRRMI